MQLIERMAQLSGLCHIPTSRRSLDLAESTRVRNSAQNLRSVLHATRPKARVSGKVSDGNAYASPKNTSYMDDRGTKTPMISSTMVGPSARPLSLLRFLQMNKSHDWSPRTVRTKSRS